MYLANEPPLHICRQLSIRYCLRLFSTCHSPPYCGVFNSKFKSSFDREPNQIPPLRIQIQPQLQVIGFRRKDTLQYSIPSTLPWLLHRPQINYSLHSLHKDDTGHNGSLIRHETVIINGLRIGHTHLTHSAWLVLRWVTVCGLVNYLGM